MRRFTLALVVMMAVAVPSAAAQESGGSVTVIHGIPGLTVDVYVNGDLTIEDFEPGDVAGPLQLPAGTYDLAITAADADISAAVLTGTATVTDGIDASIIANLDASGDPTISIFANDVSSVAAGDGRLIVRHTAFAPEVDILLADGTEVFTSVPNGAEGQIDLPAASYDVEIAPAGAGVAASVFSAAGVQIPEGTVRIVYATGDLAGGTFGLVIQDITELHTPPSRVDTGDSTPAGGATGLLVVLLALSVITAAVALPSAVRRSR